MPVETIIVGKEGIGSKGIPAHTHFHKDLLGLTSDDHLQYFNQSRLDNYLLTNHYINNINNAGTGLGIFKQLSDSDPRIAVLRNLLAGTGINLSYSPDGNDIIISSTVTGGGGGGTGLLPLFDAIVDGTTDTTSTPPHYATVYDAIQAGKRSLLIHGSITETNDIDLTLNNTVTTSVFIQFTANSTWNLGTHKIFCGTTNFLKSLYIQNGTLIWANTDDTPFLNAQNGSTSVYIINAVLQNNSTTTSGTSNIGNCLDCNLLLLNNVFLYDTSNGGVKFNWGFRGLIIATNVITFPNQINTSQNPYTVFEGVGIVENMLVFGAVDSTADIIKLSANPAFSSFMRSINLFGGRFNVIGDNSVVDSVRIISAGSIIVNGNANTISNIFSNLGANEISIQGNNNMITNSVMGNGAIKIISGTDNIVANSQASVFVNTGANTHISNLV